MERATGLGAASPRKRCGPCGPLRAALEKCSRTFLSSAPAIGFESMECAQRKKTPIAGSLTIAGAGNGTRTRECQLGKLMPASPSPFKNNPLELVLYWMRKLENVSFGKSSEKTGRLCRENAGPHVRTGVRVSGAGDGIRTRGCQHGKLGPYHLATPACVFAGSTSVGDSIPCQFSRDKASPRKRTRSARKRLTRQPSRPCPCSGSRAPHSSTVCTRHRGRRCTTGSRARG